MAEGNERVFVDTNILIYAYDISSQGKHEVAQDLVARLWDSGRGCISIQVLQEAYVTLTKKIAIPLMPSEALEVVGDLGQWHLHEPRLKSIVSAIEITQRNSVSFWDAMILCSAKEMGCKTIYSEDLNSGQSYEGIKVINPFRG